MKKNFGEIPMVTLGAGAAIFGASLTYIGALAVRKNFYGGSLCMGVGASLAWAGSQVAVGSYGRVMGKE